MNRLFSKEKKLKKWLKIKKELTLCPENFLI